ncbi:Chloroplast envelope membrane protein [Platanthera zijinensis]|uniref:Chloroplast envelope membrane protein n=1 Tax=Platanthera zijinensis TaxID=2320716 RepID=A0AAP0G6X0_9ASPA
MELEELFLLDEMRKEYSETHMQRLRSYRNAQGNETHLEHNVHFHFSNTIENHPFRYAPMKEIDLKMKGHPHPTLTMTDLYLWLGMDYQSEDTADNQVKRSFALSSTERALSHSAFLLAIFCCSVPFVFLLLLAFLQRFNGGFPSYSSRRQV